MLLEAFTNGQQELHGWALKTATGRSGPTVYGVLDRLEDAKWIAGQWEEQQAEQNRPRRRLYRLTPSGAIAVQQLLTTRRPHQSSHRPPHPQPGPAFTGRLRLRLHGADQW